MILDICDLKQILIEKNLILKCFGIFSLAMMLIIGIFLHALYLKDIHF